MTLDPTQYQVAVNNKIKLVSELSIEELQQELCRVIDLVEALGDLASQQENLINNWSSAKMSRG